jgi:hypothetical protein
MTVDVFPQSLQGTGTVRVEFIPALINPEAPTIAEVGPAATDTLDATPYFRASDFQINHEQARIDDTRLSDDTAREALGISTFSAESLTYVHHPQAAPDTPGNLAYSTFVPGTSGYFLVRFGPKSSVAIAAAQRVQVYAVTGGDRHPPSPTGDNAVHVIQQVITLNRETGDFLLAA